MDDDAIVALVRRLARPYASGIERAAILAEGADCASVMAWIADHDGQPETAVAAVAKRGLYGSRDTGAEHRRPASLCAA